MQLLLHAGEPGLPPPGGGQDLQRRIQLRPLQVHHPLQEYNLHRSHATSIISFLFGFLCPIALLSWSVILYNLKLERGRLPSNEQFILKKQLTLSSLLDFVLSLKQWLDILIKGKLS